MTTLTQASVSTYQGKAGETVTMAEIRVDTIVIPPFQRDRIRGHIQKLAAEWDETAYAFPVIAFFRDHFVCIDGQQRLAAAEERGQERATVLLILGVTSPSRMAELFLLLNRDRRLLNPFQKFVAALESKDTGTITADRIVTAANLEVGKSATIGGKIPAGAVWRIYGMGGKNLLQHVLDVREAAWGATPSRERNEAATLLGLASFLKRYSEKVDMERLVRVLAKHHPGYLLQAVSTVPTQSYADYLRDQYNRGLRGKLKL